MAQAYILEPIGSANDQAHGGAGGTIALALGIALAVGATDLLAQPGVATAAEAEFWYMTGKTVPQAKTSAIAHLRALEKTATGTILTKIQEDLKALGA